MERSDLIVGITCRMAHEEPARDRMHGRPMPFMAHSMAAWIMARGVRAYMLPFAYPDTSQGEGAMDALARRLVAPLDALVLQGGVDLSPRTYGQEPLRPEWSGDAARDAWEIALLRAAMALDRPVLGICRGLQLMNAAFGGTLYQDVATQRPDAIIHTDAARYDRLAHEVQLTPDTPLASAHGTIRRGGVISVHHQAIDRLADGLLVEATCPHDGLIEAVRLDGAAVGVGDVHVSGVQWHPEFQPPDDRPDPALPPMLPRHAVLDDLLDAALRRASARVGEKATGANT